MSEEEIRWAATGFCDPTGTLRGEFGLWIENLEDESAQPYGMLMEAAGQAALLHYFSDCRHTQLDQPIAPDGSNIQHLPLLKETFDWYVEWMVMLHQTKLLKIDKEDKRVLIQLWVRNWDDLKRFIPKIDESPLDHLELLGNKLYSSPFEQLANVYQHRPELEWIREWREEILRVLIEMQKATERFAGNQPDKEAAVRRAFMSLHPTAWLLVRLIDAEECFEKELEEWHVEDEHVRKRIFVLDDKNMARLLPCGEATSVWKEYEEEILDLVRDISDKTRRNFDYRLLRDWGRGRAFKKMDLVIDTEGKEDVKAAIAQVLGIFNGRGKLSHDLFGCHPIELEHARKGSDERCPVCWEDWADGDVRITTHCDHQFHPSCIFGSWDLPGYFDFACPKCRAPGRRLLDRVHIPNDLVRKENDSDLWRFSDEGLEEFDAMVNMAKTWQTNPDQEYEGVWAGRYKKMPFDLWEVWAKSIRRELVERSLEENPMELQNKQPDLIASWPRPDPRPVEEDDDLMTAE